MNKAIFWDRDGVLNHVVAERQDGEKNVSPHKFEDFKLVAGVSEVLKQVKELGYLNIIATKQPDIARGKMPQAELKKMHDSLRQEIPSIDAIYVCPHDNEDNCNCRKPKPGLILEAVKEHNINLQQSFMVGDQQSDIDAAKNAGVKSILIRTSDNQAVSGFDHIIGNLGEVLGIL